MTALDMILMGWLGRKTSTQNNSQMYSGKAFPIYEQQRFRTTYALSIYSEASVVPNNIACCLDMY